MANAIYSPSSSLPPVVGLSAFGFFQTHHWVSDKKLQTKETLILGQELKNNPPKSYGTVGEIFNWSDALFVFH